MTLPRCYVNMKGDDQREVVYEIINRDEEFHTFWISSSRVGIIPLDGDMGKLKRALGGVHYDEVYPAEPNTEYEFERVNDRIKLTTGLHQGEFLDKVPKRYLEFLLSVIWTCGVVRSEAFQAEIKKELACR